MRIPTAEHPITIEPERRRVVVRSGDTVIAESQDALVLQEASYPPVHYLPPEDVDWSILEDSETTTFCPFKGDASYATLRLASGTEVSDVLWKYDDPYPAVEAIRGHVAFYGDKVEIAVEGGSAA